MPDRHDEIAAFYRAEAQALQRMVNRSVRAPLTTVEDACQHAWCQLVRHPDVTLDQRGFWWLHRTATRKVWDMTNPRRAVLDLDAPATDEGDDTIADLLAGGQEVHRVAEQREVIALLRLLPDRHRRAMFLQVAGFKLAEIGRLTGESERSVSRLIWQARRSLRSLRRELDIPDR